MLSTKRRHSVLLKIVWAKIKGRVGRGWIWKIRGGERGNPELKNSIEILTLKRDALLGLSSFEVEGVTDCFLSSQFKFFPYFFRVSVSLDLSGA